MWVDIDAVNDNDERTDITAEVYRIFDHWIQVERDTETKTCDLLVCDLANTLISVGLVRPIPKEQQVKDGDRLNCLLDLREALIRALKAYTPILPTPPALAVELKKVDDAIRTLDRFYFTRLQLHGTPDGWTKEATQLFATYALYLEDELKKLKSGIEGSTA